ncbi:Lysophospholipase L1 [Amphibacillus marinus]|uniref:Lysophospholipase L1 n=1 Tax=Amphibacillus marinus TaxID=872970 RepID=A0A1H8R0M6_9BACI|nr:SGNH/GDSL hydrolase family protein [Amphibacillus marinus]SEO59841.1 Lysophospholipase L1 [Amphibacillus marinus]
MERERYLFIGDSITEWGRFEDEEGLGNNYVRNIRDHLALEKPNQIPEIINRGIGGNRVTDLVARWQTDVIELAPNQLSISIGINDVWRQIDDSNIDQVMPEQFEELYRDLIKQTNEKLPNTRIILMEPTVIEEQRDSKGNQLLKPYVEIVNKLAKEFRLTIVPTHQAFIDYLSKVPDCPLTIDGVHMSSTGNALMAKTWLDTI